MKKLVVALVFLAGPALVAAPAGAAVPKNQPTETIGCPDGSGTARLWHTRREAS